MKSKILLLTVAMVFALRTFAETVETDHEWYLAGEAMKVSVTIDDDNALIAYAELCDTHGLAASGLVGLNGGVGESIVELPSDLHSGYYVLSVYTRDNPLVSHRLVAVVNPLRKSENDDIEWIRIMHPDSLSYAQASKGESADLIDHKDVGASEKEGHIIKARVKNVYEGNTFRDSQIRSSLSIVGKQIHYFEGKMENDSMTVFYTYGLHGKLPMVLSAISSTGVSLPIEIISPFATLLPKKLPHLLFHYQRSEIEDRSIIMQRHQRLRVHASAEMTATASGTILDYDEMVFGTKPDITYNLDEYRQFLTVREVLLEYVIGVVKKKDNGVTQLSVHRDSEHYSSMLPTLVLIDGMPVSNIEQLLNYDARRIHYINIYNSQYTFGYGIYDGIISFVTRSGQLTNYPTESNAQYLVYEFPE